MDDKGRRIKGNVRIGQHSPSHPLDGASNRDISDRL
jgi:hypothetical protein